MLWWIFLGTKAIKMNSYCPNFYTPPGIVTFLCEQKDQWPWPASNWSQQNFNFICYFNPHKTTYITFLIPKFRFAISTLQAKCEIWELNWTKKVYISGECLQTQYDQYHIDLDLYFVICCICGLFTCVKLDVNDIYVNQKLSIYE